MNFGQHKQGLNFRERKIPSDRLSSCGVGYQSSYPTKEPQIYFSQCWPPVVGFRSGTGTLASVTGTEAEALSDGLPSTTAKRTRGSPKPYYCHLNRYLFLSPRTHLCSIPFSGQWSFHVSVLGTMVLTSGSGHNLGPPTYPHLHNYPLLVCKRRRHWLTPNVHF